MTAKKAVKKVANKVAKPKEEISLSLWQISDNIEEVSIRIESIKCVVQLLAESTFNDETTVAWLISDLLDDSIKRLDELSAKVMQEHMKVQNRTNK
jgi:hypothetical protein